MKHIVAAAVLAVALGGCTQYRPMGFSGGFSEVPLAANSYQISVRGNAFARSSSMKEMAILRGAELAKENGYNHFIITDIDSYTSISTYTTSGSSTTTTHGTATAYGYGNTATAFGTSHSSTTYNPPQTQTYSKPATDLVVVFVPDDKANELGALSVPQVYGLYAKKYGLVD